MHGVLRAWGRVRVHVGWQVMQQVVSNLQASLFGSGLGSGHVGHAKLRTTCWLECRRAGGTSFQVVSLSFFPERLSMMVAMMEFVVFLVALHLWCFWWHCICGVLGGLYLSVVRS